MPQFHFAEKPTKKFERYLPNTTAVPGFVNKKNYLPKTIMEDFQVYLTMDCPNKTYYPGQILSGNIGVVLSQQQDLSAIHVQYVGTAVVEWEEKYDSCTDKEEYFNFTHPVFGGNGTTMLPPGTHRFAFQYQIPFSVPSTFKGSKGKVWYRVLAHIQVPGKQTRTVEQEFTVVAVVDLNGDIEIMRPISMEFEEVVSCCCFDSAPVNIRVCLPTSGYCPGQTMPIQVAVDNKSSVEVHHLLFQLSSVESYRVRHPETDCTEPMQVLAEIKRGPVLTKTQKEFTANFVVPDMIVPNIDNCQLIDIHYYFKVIIKLTGCSGDNSDATEVALGSIPLISSQSNYIHPLKDKLPLGPVPVPPQAPVINQAPVNFVQMTPQAPSYPLPQAPPYPLPQTQQPLPQVSYPLPQAQQPIPQVYYPLSQAQPKQYKQELYTQNDYYYDAAAPQSNWQWDSGIAPSAPSVGYSYTAIPQEDYGVQDSAMNYFGSESSRKVGLNIYPESVPLKSTNYADVSSVTTDQEHVSSDVGVSHDNVTHVLKNKAITNVQSNNVDYPPKYPTCTNNDGHVSSVNKDVCVPSDNNADICVETSTTVDESVPVSSTNCDSGTSAYECSTDCGGESTSDCGGGNDD